MKDEELHLEEIEPSHTLGGSVIHVQIRQSHGLRQTMSVWVVITDTVHLLFCFLHLYKVEPKTPCLFSESEMLFIITEKARAKERK